MLLKSPKEKYKLDRPRERLAAKGVEALVARELLQILVGSGTAKHNVANIAAEVEVILRSSAGKPTLSQLKVVKGLGDVGAARILAALNLHKHFMPMPSIGVHNADGVLPYVRNLLNKQKEYLIALTLNGMREVINTHLISVGLVNSTLIHPREVFLPAVNDLATGIILAHNHPSGIATPSEDDINITKIIYQAGNIMGIDLVDHVIVTKQEIYSLKEHSHF